MADDNKKTTSSSGTVRKKVTLPKVDPSKVSQLNEGVKPKTSGSTKEK